MFMHKLPLLLLLADDQMMCYLATKNPVKFPSVELASRVLLRRERSAPPDAANSPVALPVMIEFETRAVAPANALTTPNWLFVISHLSKSNWIEPPEPALPRTATPERLKSESRATTFTVLPPCGPV